MRIVATLLQHVAQQKNQVLRDQQSMISNTPGFVTSIPYKRISNKIVEGKAPRAEALPAPRQQSAGSNDLDDARRRLHIVIRCTFALNVDWPDGFHPPFEPILEKKSSPVYVAWIARLNPKDRQNCTPQSSHVSLVTRGTPMKVTRGRRYVSGETPASTFWEPPFPHRAMHQP
jgi:hypothetical protein